MRSLVCGIWLLVALDARASSLPFIDEIMSAYGQENHPGAAVIVIKDDQVLHLKGYGVADREANTIVTENTSFRLASVSKQFIAMGIAMLESEDVINLDQSLIEIIPEFPTYGRAIKIRHLVHHLSGLPDYEDLIPSNQTSQLTDNDVLDIYIKKTRSTRFQPGTQYSYSNGGYVLLGLIIERVSGQRLDRFLNKRIFSRLGMSSVMYQGEESPIVARAFGYSQTAGGWKRTDQNITSATRGDGGIYASIKDLALWNRALEQKLNVPLVSDEILEEIFSPGKLESGQSCGYAFGWQIDKWRGIRRQSHTGSTIGFRTVIQRFPEHSLMISILTNRNGGTPWFLAEQIADRILTPLPAHTD